MTKEIPTVLIPAPEYDEALDFCRARRKERGITEPLDALPTGKRGDSYSCPCANTCDGLIVGADGEWLWEGGESSDGGPSHFVAYFDAHAPHGVCLPVRAPDSGASP